MEIDEVTVTRSGYRFTYYRVSGGLVVSTRAGHVIDAGIVGNARGESITPRRLNDIAWKWLLWRREYETVKKTNQPAEEVGRKNQRG